MNRPDSPKKQRDNQAAAFRRAAPYLSIGYVFLGSTLIFAYIGYKLDQYFNSRGLILLGAVLAALILSFYRMILVFREMNKKNG